MSLNGIDVWDVMFLVTMFLGAIDIMSTIVSLEYISPRFGLHIREGNPLLAKFLCNTNGNYRYLMYIATYYWKVILILVLFLATRYLSEMFGLLFAFLYVIHVFIVANNFYVHVASFYRRYKAGAGCAACSRCDGSSLVTCDDKL